MIKKLHYVWLGGKPLPAVVRDAIDTWKKHCPDWEILQWNETNFPINDYRWVREAVELRKYAFAADFIRLWVLKTYGGGYCDTDVTFVRSIENSIKAEFVCAIENHLVGTGDIAHLTLDGMDDRTGLPMTRFGMQTGFLYSEPEHPFVTHCMKTIYDDGQRPFVKDGKPDLVVIDGALIGALKDFGFAFKDETQILDSGILIYDSSVYATRKTRNKNTFVIHWFDQSWQDSHNVMFMLKRMIKKHFYFLFRK